MLSEPLDLTIIYEPNTKMNYVPDYPGIPTTQVIKKFITINNREVANRFFIQLDQANPDMA